MTQQLIALAALAENQGSVPSTHVGWLTTTCNSSSRLSDLFSPPNAPAHTSHTYSTIHTKKINK